MTINVKTYSIFADEVRYDNELPFSCRVVFAEIAALAKQNGYCFANNSYFAKKFNVSISSVSKWLHMLEKRNYVYIEYIRRGSHVKCRKIYLNTDLCDGYKYLRKSDNIPSSVDNSETLLEESTIPADKKDKNTTSKNKKPVRIGEYGNLKNVYLSEDEYKKIIQRCGYQEAMILINDLSYHLGSTGRRYKSHYHTIISWYRRKASKKVNQPTSWYKDYGEENDE